MGINRFMSETRALTKLIGNGMAAVAVAKSEGAFDQAQFKRELGQGMVRL